MNKKLKIATASLLTLAMISTALTGTMQEASAYDDSRVELKPWSFTQGGVYSTDEDTENGNVAYINSVAAGEQVIEGWERGIRNVQTQTADAASDNFVINIENNGWDGIFGIKPEEKNRMNPWSISAHMDGIEIMPGHIYEISFTASATKKKYAYLKLNTELDIPPYGDDTIYSENNMPVFEIGETEKTYTFHFVNWVSAINMDIDLMLGAFFSQYGMENEDYGMVIKDQEVNWSGEITISNLKLVDEGLYILHPWFPEPETTKEILPPTTSSTISTQTWQTAATSKVTTTTTTSKKLQKVLAKSLKLTAKKKIKAGKKLTIKATIKPKKVTSKKVKWSVSNKRYAVISKKGVLTAKKAGRGKTVTVTCRLLDGSKKVAKIKIKITK